MTIEEKIEAQIDDLKKQATKAIEDFERLLDTPIPDIDGLAVADAATEKYLPALKQSELDEWRKRFISIRAANKVLSKFEQDVTNALTFGSAAILARQIHQIVKSYEWVLGHIFEISHVVSTVVEESLGQVEWSKVYRSLQSALSLVGTPTRERRSLGESKVNPDKGFTALVDWLYLVKDEIKRFTLTAVELATLTIALEVLKESLASFSLAKFEITLIPLRKILNDAKQAIQRSALPQGTGRVRRRKVHRIR